jgi:hypothetical protein
MHVDGTKKGTVVSQRTWTTVGARSAAAATRRSERERGSPRTRRSRCCRRARARNETASGRRRVRPGSAEAHPREHDPDHRHLGVERDTERRREQPPATISSTSRQPLPTKANTPPRREIGAAVLVRVARRTSRGGSPRTCQASPEEPPRDTPQRAPSQRRGRRAAREGSSRPRRLPER